MGLCRDQPFRQNVTRLSNCLVLFICSLACGILTRDSRDFRADVSYISVKILYCHLQLLLLFKTKYSEEEMRKMVTRKMLWANIQTKAFQSPAVLNQGLDWSPIFALTSLSLQTSMVFRSHLSSLQWNSLFVQVSPLQAAGIITVSVLFIYKSSNSIFLISQKPNKILTQKYMSPR